MWTRSEIKAGVGVPTPEQLQISRPVDISNENSLIRQYRPPFARSGCSKIFIVSVISNIQLEKPRGGRGAISSPGAGNHLDVVDLSEKSREIPYELTLRMLVTNDIEKALFGNEIHPKLVSVGKIAVPSIFGTAE
jgi:hypothetical protein